MKMIAAYIVSTRATGQNSYKSIFLWSYWTSALNPTVEHKPLAAAWLDRVAGTLFIGFGIKLALTQSPNA